MQHLNTNVEKFGSTLPPAQLLNAPDRDTTECATGSANWRTWGSLILRWRSLDFWDLLTLADAAPVMSLFPLWRYGRGLAIDVAVICPTAASHIHQEHPCEVYAQNQKHDLYDAGFAGSNYDFAAMVFETSGALNSEGTDILKQIIRFASKRECVGNSWFAGRAWARVSCCIQTAVSQAILNRDYYDVL